jgi:hypothetical protein
MKAFKLFLLGLVISLSAFSQKPISDYVDIRLPGLAQKITKEELQVYVKGKKQYFQKIDRLKTTGDIYRINSSILQLNAGSLKAPKDLDQLKASFDRMATASPEGYSSEIRAINNYKVLIMHQAREDYASYSFYSIDSSSTRALNGSIEYNKYETDAKAKAEQLLNDLLNRMKFK